MHKHLRIKGRGKPEHSRSGSFLQTSSGCFLVQRPRYEKGGHRGSDLYKVPRRVRAGQNQNSGLPPDPGRIWLDTPQSSGVRGCYLSCGPLYLSIHAIPCLLLLKQSMSILQGVVEERPQGCWISVVPPDDGWPLPLRTSREVWTPEQNAGLRCW